MAQITIEQYFEIKPLIIPTSIVIETPRSKRKVLVELYNCDENYLKSVKRVICIHPASHSVALFLKMKDKGDLCLYCHPLLAKESSKDFVISYTQKYNYPLVILTRMENIEDLMRENGVPHKWRRWCTRVFKIEPVRLFYKKFIPSGIIEYIGIQKIHSKERSEMNPELIEDAKSQKRYKIYREMPIFYESEEFNIEIMKEANIRPFNDSVRGYNRYGCFLCPFAGKEYYKQLKETDIKTYNRCNKLMEIGSQKNINEGKREERYYFYPKSKIM